MHLMYYLNEKGERVYTLKVSTTAASVARGAAVTRTACALVFLSQKANPEGQPTHSAHPGTQLRRHAHIVGG